MSASPVLSSAALGRPFVLGPRPPACELLANLRATQRLAAIAPASRLEVRPSPEMVSSGVRELDALTGGFPRGCLTEISGTSSSGSTSVMLAALAQATQRGEVCALVDASDALDPSCAAAAKIDLARLLWIRCAHKIPSRKNNKGKSSYDFFVEGGALFGETNSERAERRSSTAKLEQVLKVTDLLLQSNGFGMIVLDLGDIPPRSARRIPLASWFRFRRAIEHTQTVLLVLEQQPIAGSCSSIVLKLSATRPEISGTVLSPDRPAHAELLDGFAIRAELLRSRFDRKLPQSVANFPGRTKWAG